MTIAKDEKATADKEEPLKRKDKFKCKKCGEMKPSKDARPLIVMQRNKPIEFEHLQFSSKAEVMICKECYQLMKRA